MNKDTLSMLGSLGTWFDFYVYEAGDQTYIRGRSGQWYYWNGKDWAHVSETRVPRDLVRAI